MQNDESKPSFTLVETSPHLTGAFTLQGVGAPLLTIRPDGTVEAPSLEAASEAGRVFVESIRHYLRLEATDAKDQA